MRRAVRGERTMRRVPIVAAFLIGLAVVGSVQPAQAQTRYRIDRPTFNPWFQLFRQDPGPLGRYHSYVRPTQQLRRTLTGQAIRIEQQQARIGALQGQVTTLQEIGAVRPTGTGSVFMNYSHYYTGAGGGGGSRSYSRPSSSGYSGSFGAY